MIHRFETSNLPDCPSLSRIQPRITGFHFIVLQDISGRKFLAPKPSTTGYDIENARFLGAKIWRTMPSSVQHEKAATFLDILKMPSSLKDSQTLNFSAHFSCRGPHLSLLSRGLWILSAALVVTIKFLRDDGMAQICRLKLKT